MVSDGGIDGDIDPWKDKALEVMEKAGKPLTIAALAAAMDVGPDLSIMQANRLRAILKAGGYTSRRVRIPNSNAMTAEWYKDAG